jgi:hypothetical protein
MKDDRHNIIDEDAALVAPWRAATFLFRAGAEIPGGCHSCHQDTDDYEDACEMMGRLYQPTRIDSFVAQLTFPPGWQISPESVEEPASADTGKETERGSFL